MPLISNTSLTPTLSRIAVCIVVFLIICLSYPSQYYLLWSNWSTEERLWFNFLIACILISYYRSVTTDPGTLVKDWAPASVDETKGMINEEKEGAKMGRVGKLWGADIGRWCKKCEAWKPPRAHHCKTCKRCVLRMDHHCPWTNNCVGYRNLPHFMRFLSFSSLTAAYLEYHLLRIAYEIWEFKELPSYEGTYTLRSIAILILLFMMNTFLFFVLIVLFIRNIWGIAEGTTTIEYWEKDRHDSLVRRRVVKKVNFLWDIGIWENLCEAMGNGWWFLWWWPFAPSRKVYGDNGKVEGRGWSWDRDGGGGFRWEVNGFEDPRAQWPPLDPEKSAYMRLPHYTSSSISSLHTGSIASLTNEEYITEFRRRQAEDLKRFKKNVEDIKEEEAITNTRTIGRSGWDGMWRNADGETLGDYGVDEEVEWGAEVAGSAAMIGTSGGSGALLDHYHDTGHAVFMPQGVIASHDGDDDEDVPLGELLRQRKRRGDVGM